MLVGESPGDAVVLLAPYQTPFARPGTHDQCDLLGTHTCYISAKRSHYRSCAEPRGTRLKLPLALILA